MNFETAILGQLQALTTPTVNQQRLIGAILYGASPTLGIRRAEAKAMAILNIPPGSVVDWGSGQAGKTAINWANLLSLLEQYLPDLLALFGIVV